MLLPGERTSEAEELFRDRELLVPAASLRTSAAGTRGQHLTGKHLSIKMPPMGKRTTVDLPEDLFRRAKAEAALRGRKLKDLVAEGLRRVLESPEASRGGEPPGRPTAWDVMQAGCGIVRSGVGDLASDPDRLRGLGRDSVGDR